MNKKTYKTPSIRITEVDLSHSLLLAGSPEPSSEVGVKSDGDGITVSKEDEGGTKVDVYDSKHYNTWEAWDEY